eukprot:768397-Hanusia_phi.AAC.12
MPLRGCQGGWSRREGTRRGKEEGEGSRQQAAGSRQQAAGRQEENAGGEAGGRARSSLVEGAAEGEVHEARRLLCFLRHSHCASSLDEADHSRIVLPCAQAHEVALVQEVSAGDEGAGAEDAEDGDSEVLPVVLIRDAVAEAVEMHRRVAVVLDDPLNCSLLDVVDVLIAKRLLGQVLSLAQRYGDGELVVSEHELERLDLRLDQTVVRCPVEEKVSHLWLQMNFHVECLVSQLIGAVLVQHVDIALAEDDDVAAFIERGVEH